MAPASCNDPAHADLLAIVTRQSKQIAALTETVAAQAKRIAALEERVGRDSSNS